MSRSPTSRDTDEDVDARLEIVDVAEAAPVPLHYFDDGSQSKKLADDDDNLVGGLENIGDEEAPMPVQYRFDNSQSKKIASPSRVVERLSNISADANQPSRSTASAGVEESIQGDNIIPPTRRETASAASIRLGDSANRSNNENNGVQVERNESFPVVAEAYLAEEGNNNMLEAHAERRPEENSVVDAQPMRPYSLCKDTRVRVVLALVVAIVVAFAVALGVSLSSSNANTPTEVGEGSDNTPEETTTEPTQLSTEATIFTTTTSTSSMNKPPPTAPLAPAAEHYGPYTVTTGETPTLGYRQSVLESEVLQVPYGYMFVAEESMLRIVHCQGDRDAQTVSFEQWSNCVMCGDNVYASTVEVSYMAESPMGWCNAGKIGKLTWGAILPLVERTDECKDWNYPCPDFSDKKVIAC